MIGSYSLLFPVAASIKTLLVKSNQCLNVLLPLYLTQQILSCNHSMEVDLDQLAVDHVGAHESDWCDEVNNKVFPIINVEDFWEEVNEDPK